MKYLRRELSRSKPRRFEEDVSQNQLLFLQWQQLNKDRLEYFYKPYDGDYTNGDLTKSALDYPLQMFSQELKGLNRQSPKGRKLNMVQLKNDLERSLKQIIGSEINVQDLQSQMLGNATTAEGLFIQYNGEEMSEEK